MIKKFICAVCCTVCLFAVNASALTVGNEFYVYGEQTAQLAEVIGMSETELAQYCKDNSITYLAVNKTNSKQIRKTEITDDFSKKVVNLSALSDEDILQLTEELSGYGDVSGEVITEKTQKFLKTQVKTADSGGEYIITQYVTVSGSVTSMLTFYTDSGEDTDYVEDVFQSQFKTDNTYKIIAIVGIIVFTAAAIVIAVLLVKDMKNKD